MALVLGNSPYVLKKEFVHFQDCFQWIKSLSADSTSKVTCQGLTILLSNLYHGAWHKAVTYLWSEFINDVTSCFHSWTERALYHTWGPVNRQHSLPVPVYTVYWSYQMLNFWHSPRLPHNELSVDVSLSPGQLLPVLLCTWLAKWFNAHKQLEIRSFLKILFIKKLDLIKRVEG